MPYFLTKHDKQRNAIEVDMLRDMDKIIVGAIVQAWIAGISFCIGTRDTKNEGI